ncbi:hypothetical protein SO802_017644 [Lithocarpus litseifolius]|uniref:Uncharacterized protein n=1 Tax=Lithocarpus litseifolius TaxID=425828 RepID=A0AAW2CIK8_9ROSI
MGTSKEIGGDQSKKPSIWRPIFTLSSGNPLLEDANLRDPKKGSSGLLKECLEKVLCLPEDMAELRAFKKREVFLALKQGLAKGQALSAARIGIESELRAPDKVYYPPTLHLAPTSPQPLADSNFAPPSSIDQPAFALSIAPITNQEQEQPQEV